MLYRKTISALMAAMLLLSSWPGEGFSRQAAAAPAAGNAAPSAAFADMAGHWAAASAEKLSKAGILQGDGQGRFEPGRAVTRAELSAVLARVFRYAEQGTITFSDVSASSWYEAPVRQAYAAGLVTGYPDGRFAPNAPVTRQEAMTLLYRAFGLEPEQRDALAAKPDGAEVKPYAREAANALIAAGYLGGGGDGRLKPQEDLTRGELAALLGRMIGWISPAEGSYTIGDVTGSVIVNRPGVTVKGGAVTGNLYVTAGVGEGEAAVSGVKVSGATRISGGGSHSVVFRGASLQKVIVDKPGSPVRVALEDGTAASRLELVRPALLELSAGSRAGELLVGASAGGSSIKNQGSIGLLKVAASGVRLNDQPVQEGASLQGVGGAGPSPSASPSAGTGGGPATNPTAAPTPSATPVPSATPSTDDDQWELVWNDEFNGSSIDTSKWNVQDTGVVYNNELEYYHPSNAFVEKEGGNGVLTLEARKQGYEGKQYTSGKLTSKLKGDWTYGKFTVRAKLPVQQGMWPAIWMMPTDEEKQYGPWPGSGEMDIMELTGPVAGDEEKADLYPRTVHGSLHYDIPHASQSKTYVLPPGQTFADDYHEFTMEWLPGLIRYYVDGKKYFESSDWGTKAAGQPDYYAYPAPFDRPFYMILNLAVGGDWPGNPAGDFQSDRMYVDYVRVYQYKNLENWPVPTGERPTPPEAAVPQRPALADGNQIYNGDFTEGAATNGVPKEWEFITNASGAGSVSVVEDQDKSQVAKVAISDGGTQNYSIQLTQMPLLLEKNKAYKVTFEAKADQDRPIMSKLTQFGGGWTAYSEERNFQLTNQWQSYEYTFNMKQTTDNNVRFEFNLGKNTVPAYFANVRVVETDPLPVVRTPLADGNLIYNGGFELGAGRMEYWTFGVKPDSGAEAKAQVTNRLELPLMKREFSSEVTKAGSSAEAVSLSQADLPLSPGSYRLSFDARTEDGQGLALGLKAGSQDAIFPDGNEIALTSDWKNYTAELVVPGAADVKGTLSFLLGRNAGTTELDNVSLVRMAAPAALNGYLHLQGDQFWTASGVSLVPSGEGRQEINGMDTGDYADFKVTVGQGGTFIPMARVASADAGSSLQLSVLDEAKRPVVTAAVYASGIGDTGGLRSYRALTGLPLTLARGTYYFRLEGQGYNLAWLDLTRELIVNGSVDTNTSEGWTLFKKDWIDSDPVKNTGMTADNGDLRIDVGGSGDEDWNVQVKQGHLPLVKGNVYRLQFDADASLDRQIRVVLQRDGTEDKIWTPYFNETASLTGAGGHYAYDFTAPATDSEALLQFNLGKVTEMLGEHRVTLDNISLLRVNPVLAGHSYAENLLPNGDFAGPLQGWTYYSPDNGELAISNIDQTLAIQVGSAGSNSWDRQVYYEGISYEDGGHYTLTFKAKSTKPRSMNVSIGWLDAANNYTWHGYTSSVVEVGSDYTEYTVEFDVTGGGTPIGRISFELGKIGEDNTGNLQVKIDDIHLVKEDRP